MVALAFSYSAEPATMRMALLTNKAKVNKEVANSKMEYLRQVRMDAMDGRYVVVVVVPLVSSSAPPGGAKP